MTKYEQVILAKVRRANEEGWLAGLPTHASAVSPDALRSTCYGRFRFVKRLYEAGAILWLDYTKTGGFGRGWVLPEFEMRFPLPDKQAWGIFDLSKRRLLGAPHVYHTTARGTARQHAQGQVDTWNKLRAGDREAYGGPYEARPLREPS